MSFWKDVWRRIVESSERREKPKRGLVITGGGSSRPEAVAYFTFCCAMDDESCEACKRMDGFSFLPVHRSKFKTPIHTCTSKSDCRCQILEIFTDEGTTQTTDSSGNKTVYHSTGDAADIAAFLRLKGGAAKLEAIDSHFGEIYAAKREAERPERESIELAQHALMMERVSAEESIPLYRDAVQALKAVHTLRLSSEFRWDWLDSSYDRLTIILTKLHRYREAIQEIDDYRAFCEKAGRHDLRATIVKREIRLRKKPL